MARALHLYLQHERSRRAACERHYLAMELARTHAEFVCQCADIELLLVEQQIDVVYGLCQEAALGIREPHCLFFLVTVAVGTIVANGVLVAVGEDAAAELAAQRALAVEQPLHHGAQFEAAMRAQTLSMENKLALIEQVISNVNTTLDVKIGAIEAAMKEQTIALTEKMKIIESVMRDQKTAFETKIDLFTKAVMNLPRYDEILEAIKTALINVNPNEQLKLLEGVLEKYFSDELKYPDDPLSYKGKLYYLIAEIEDTMHYMTYTDDKFKAIRDAIKNSLATMRRLTPS